MYKNVDKIRVKLYNGNIEIKRRELVLEKRRSKTKIFFKIFFLAGLIALMLILSVESLMPGEKSAESSNVVSDKVDEVITDMTADAIKKIPPQSVRILTGDESAEVLILNCNSTFTPEIQILPTNTSVNYRKTVWTSSAENIVSVDANGQLNAKAIGTATVTISLEGYESVNDSIEIQVVEVFANDLQLHLTTSELPVGKTTALKAALSPANATSRGLTYKSSDKEVAEVSSAGIVRAKKEGKVTISVSYLSLTDKNGEKFAITREVTLTVVPNTEPNIPLEKIELSLEDNGSIFYDEGKDQYYVFAGESISQSVTLTPADATDRLLVWSSSDASVLQAGGEDGTCTLTPLKKGTATIRVSAAANSNVSTEFTLEVRNSTLGAVIGVQGGKSELKPTDRPNVFTLNISAGARGILFAVSAATEEFYIKYDTDEREIAEIYEDGTLSTYKSSAGTEEGYVTLKIIVSDNDSFSSDGGGLCETYEVRLTVSKQTFSENVSGWALFIRKLFGHFGAFLVLGIFAAGTFILFSKKNWKSLLIGFFFAIVFGFTFACVTELFQMDIFTSGRHASFDDVVIDCSGYMPAVLAIYGAVFITWFIIAIVRKSKKKRDIQDDLKGAE